MKPATRRCCACRESKALVLFPRGRGWRKCVACTESGRRRSALALVCDCGASFSSASPTAKSCSDDCRRRRRARQARERRSRAAAGEKH